MTNQFIVCDDCKTSFWITQGYGVPKFCVKTELVAEFFGDHVGHKLRFIDENVMDNDKAADYKEWDRGK